MRTASKQICCIEIRTVQDARTTISAIQIHQQAHTDKHLCLVQTLTATIPPCCAGRLLPKSPFDRGCVSNMQMLMHWCVRRGGVSHRCDCSMRCSVHCLRCSVFRSFGTETQLCRYRVFDVVSVQYGVQWCLQCTVFHWVCGVQEQSSATPLDRGDFPSPPSLRPSLSAPSTTPHFCAFQHFDPMYWTRIHTGGRARRPRPARDGDLRRHPHDQWFLQL